jgi:hypothetical protein
MVPLFFYLIYYKKIYLTKGYFYEYRRHQEESSIEYR